MMPRYRSGNNGRVLAVSATSGAPEHVPPSVTHTDPELVAFMMHDPGCVRYIRSCRVARGMTATLAADYMHIDRAALYKRIYAGTGPRMTNVHPPRFQVSDLDDWLDQQYLEAERRRR
jgi:hypothetical protein